MMTTSKPDSFFAQSKFLVGTRALEHIHIELDGYNASRPLVIYSKASGKGIVNKFIRSLADSNITIGAMVNDALGYVNIHEVNRLAGLFRWQNCDSIIALGGSSVMDVAKTLNLLLNRIDITEPLLIMDSSHTPMVYIATANINGLEVTNTVNIDGKILQSDFLFPDLVFVDSRMIKPQKELRNIAYVAIDSLTHCIEGVETSNNNPFVDASAFSAIQLIVSNLKTLLKNPKDKNAAVGLVNGICIAGTVRSNSRGDMACLCAQLLAKETGLPQGLLSRLFLPKSIRHKIDKGVELRPDLLLAIEGVEKFCSVPNQLKSEIALKSIEGLMDNLSSKLPLNPQHIKIQKHLYEDLSEQIVVLSEGRIAKGCALKFLLNALSS